MAYQNRQFLFPDSPNPSKRYFLIGKGSGKDGELSIVNSRGPGRSWPGFEISQASLVKPDMVRILRECPKVSMRRMTHFTLLFEFISLWDNSTLAINKRPFFTATCKGMSPFYVQHSELI